MSTKFCNCKDWEFYVRNYSETFYQHPDTDNWYVGWVRLSNNGGYTQVSRYAIPINFCPLCGKELKNTKKGLRK